jgi:cob(I)alamin adenosyltransferase
LVKVYTRTGDKGETGLFSSTRVSKDSPRIHAYGNIDELNSVIGLIRAFSKDEEINSCLEELQRDLFTAGADLASPSNENHEVSRVGADMILELEKSIDKFEGEVPSLKSFILPSGGEAGSLLHFARAVSRRTERSIVVLSKTEKINEHLVPYFNRMSDLLFVMARVANHRERQSEEEWHRLGRFRATP